MELCDSKVEDLGEVGVAVLVDENHVLGFDIPMNDPGVVRIGESAEHVAADVKRTLPFEARLPFEQIEKQHAVQQLQHHVEGAVAKLAEVRHVDAVRMVDAANGKRLALEAFGHFLDFFDLGMQQLQRQRSPNRNVLRKIDTAHPAGAENPGNTVARIQDIPDPRYLRIRGRRQRWRPTPPP